MPTSPSIHRLRKLFLAVLLACWAAVSLAPHYSRTPALDVWMLNVGQGESVLVREPAGHLLLYDGGPNDSVLSELGRVLPFWQQSIDLAILSHNHSDHLQGMLSVLERYKVQELWTSGAIYNSPEYKEFLRVLAGKGLTPRLMHFDALSCTQPCPPVLPFGSARLQVYRPLRDMRGIFPRDQHDATLSVKVSYGSESLFLTGDLNEGHEQELLNACHPPSCSLAATVLQVPHHGSLTGLAPAFLTAVSPRVALIPVGLHNKFGHPGALTIEKLRRAGIPTYRTDTNGRIHLVMDGKSYRISLEKG